MSLTIEKAGNSIKIVRTGEFPEYIPASGIKISGSERGENFVVFFQRLDEPPFLEINLEDVTNHVTWENTEAGLIQALTDINVWLGFNFATVESVDEIAENLSEDIVSAEQAAKDYADTLVVGLLDDRGGYNASSNLFPASGGSGTAGAIKKGDIWNITVGGTLGGRLYEIGEWVRALQDTPGQTSGNWTHTKNPQQATESQAGILKIAPQSEIVNEATADNITAVTPVRFWQGITRLLAIGISATVIIETSLKQFVTATQKLLIGKVSQPVKLNVTTAPHTGTINETILFSQFIPGVTFEANDGFPFLIRFYCNSSLFSKMCKVYINTVNDITPSATLQQIAGNSSTSGAGGVPIDRTPVFKNSLSALQCQNPTGNYTSDRTAASAVMGTMTNDCSAGVWFIVTGTLADATDNMGLFSISSGILR